MVNYKDGQIYKIVNSVSDKCYIGSTTQPLHKRFHQHKWIKANNRSRILFEEDPDGCEIVLIEKIECNDKQELHRRERYYIENMDCVNKVIPTRTNKEFRQQNIDYIKQLNKEYYTKNKNKILEYQKIYTEQNKDKVKEYQKKYNEQNKDKVKEHRKIYYEQNKDKIALRNKNYREANKDLINVIISCECGGTYRKPSKSRHLKTKKHQKYLTIQLL